MHLVRRIIVDVPLEGSRKCMVDYYALLCYSSVRKRIWDYVEFGLGLSDLSWSDDSNRQLRPEWIWSVR